MKTIFIMVFVITYDFSASSQVWLIADRVTKVGYRLPPNTLNSSRFQTWDDFKQQSQEMDAKLANAKNHSATELADCEVLCHAGWVRSLMGEFLVKDQKVWIVKKKDTTS